MHRDIKMLNIMVDFNKQVKLGDFGITRELFNQTTQTRGKFTPRYASPEMLNSNILS